MSKKQKGVPTPKGVSTEDYSQGHFQHQNKTSDTAVDKENKLDNILNVRSGNNTPDKIDAKEILNNLNLNSEELNKIDLNADADAGLDIEDIEEIKAQCEQYKDQALRSIAEMENLRRRTRVEVEKAHKYGQEKLITELLPVIDNLEQAASSIDKQNEDLKPIIEGLDLNHKLFLNTLSKFNVVEINPQDAVFNAQEHEALSMLPSADVPNNNVLSVVQKGYKLADRVIRPAKVIVSKGQDDK